MSYTEESLKELLDKDPFDIAELQICVNNLLSDGEPIQTYNLLITRINNLFEQYIRSGDNTFLQKGLDIVTQFPSIIEYNGDIASERSVLMHLCMLTSSRSYSQSQNKFENRIINALRELITKLQKSNITINFNITDIHLGNSTLHWMIANDHSDRAQKFIELLIGSECTSQFNFDKKDTSDRTALHLLVARKYFKGTHKKHKESDEELIRLLLFVGTDIGIVDEDGNNLLHIAFAKRDIETIISLKQYPEFQKCLTVENKEGKSPLDYLEEDVLYDDISQKMQSIYHDSGNDIILTEQEWKENAHKIKDLLPGWQEAVQSPTQSYESESKLDISEREEQEGNVPLQTIKSYEPNNSVFVQKSKTSKYKGAIAGAIIGTACVTFTLPLLLLKNNKVLQVVRNSLNIAIPVIVFSSLVLIALSTVIGSILNHSEEKNGVVKTEPLNTENGIQY